MKDECWDRVGGWWADLFGRRKALLWQGFSVRAHAGLGDYEGILVAHRDDGCHVSLPHWVTDDLRESLGQQGMSPCSDPTLCHELPEKAALSMLGPSVHSYTDEDPGSADGVGAGQRR